MEINCDSAIPPVYPKHPWFVVAQNPKDEAQVHIFYNICDRMSHYCYQIPELLEMRIQGCFAWLLGGSFLQPSIGSEEEGGCDDMRDCCLSAPPEDPNSVLLLMRTAKPSFVYCRLRNDPSFKDTIWIELTYANQIKMITDCDDGSLNCLTCCNGKVYAYIRGLTDIEVNIVVNDCESKKLEGEVVINLLPVLEFLCCHVASNPPLMKGSCTELFMILINIKDRGKTIVDVNLCILDVNNITWEELGDLKDTILSVELATDSSVFYSPSSELAGGYIHILAYKGKSIYSYHVKDKTIFLSSIACVAVGTNTGLGGERVHIHCKQEKEGHKEDQIVIRSVKGNHEIESHLKLLSLPNECSRLESDDDDDDESRLLNLPPHVFEMLIMEFCACVDYLNFRSTCKGCHLAAPLMSWNNRKASKIMQKYSLPSPWLIVFNKHKCIITLTDPMFGGEPSWRRWLIDGEVGNSFCSVTFSRRDVYVLREIGRLDVVKEIGGNYILACLENQLSEERSGSIFNARDALVFNDFFSNAGLFDFHLGGQRFTGFDKYGSKMSKLDRIMVTHNFFDAWPNPSVLGLERSFLDHCPLLLRVEQPNFRPKMFKVFDHWIGDTDFLTVIKSAWAFNGFYEWDAKAESGSLTPLDIDKRDEWLIDLQEIEQAEIYTHRKKSQIHRDLIFASRFWRSLQESLGTSVDMGTAYHPQTEERIKKKMSILNILEEWDAKAESGSLTPLDIDKRDEWLMDLQEIEQAEIYTHRKKSQIHASGLKVNISKSRLFGVGVDMQEGRPHLKSVVGHKFSFILIHIVVADGDVTAAANASWTLSLGLK
nr:hypothetical protein [Tanacetum cinerariifolium]